MSRTEEKLRDTLLRIAELASEAAAMVGTSGAGDSRNGRDDVRGDGVRAEVETECCTIKSLPPRLVHEAAQMATRINPLNAPAAGNFNAMGLDGIWNPQAISVLTSKYWGPAPRRLSVTFLETTSPQLRSRIIEHMNAWVRTCCVSFVETRGTGDVRISREGRGYWSYLGTDIKLIPATRATMNLQGFTMETPDREFHRVVRHETGHTLGFPHEHMRKALVERIDRQKAYAYFLRTQGWDQAAVDTQVLTPHEERSLMSTPADQTSIMCYQLPSSITTDGRPIPGGLDINPSDYAFAGRIYPKAQSSQQHTVTSEASDDWPASEDVRSTL